MTQRKAKEGTTPTSLRLPDSLRERVHLVAEERGTSFNRIVVKALELYLEYLPPIDATLPPRQEDRAAS